MASGVADSRKRSSLSCEVGKPDIADSLGGAALLSSAIADFIIKKGLPYSEGGGGKGNCKKYLKLVYFRCCTKKRGM